MKFVVTIQSAIDELQRMFKLLNDTYFGGKLERPVITLHTDHTGGSYGWITVGKVWVSKDEAYFREINLCAEHLNRPTENVITTLAHEMAHLWNLEREIQDTSRKGTYHNARFKEVAESCGLIVRQHHTYGWCVTDPGPGFTALVQKHCRAGCFKLERLSTYRDGTPKVTKPGDDGKAKTTTRTKSSYIKHTCPACGLTARTTRAAELVCGACQKTMTTEQ